MIEERAFRVLVWPCWRLPSAGHVLQQHGLPVQMEDGIKIHHLRVHGWNTCVFVCEFE